MAGKDTDKVEPQAGIDVPGPDVMLGLWASWMGQMPGSAQTSFDQGRSWWEMTTDTPAARMFDGAIKQFQVSLSQDPTLRAIDQMWNVNPLREVVPVDWAEVARALRMVWLRSLGKPRAAQAVVDLNQDLWRSALTTWQEAGQRWLGLAGASSAAAPPAAADKRFAAPEWHTNPVYRTLREVYLLASDWLLEQSDVGDMDEAERRRICFHLRQFVDAMSPTLILLSNPAALQRAVETGGASVVAGASNLMADLSAGRLTMVDAEAFAPGRNLALTPGKVVHRNRLIELIQYEPTTEQVHQIPLLIVPPWINKYYILDMQPKNSMVRHLVGQGFTVFVISWKNPDASMDEIGIEDYMDLGPLEASDVVREITGSPTVNVMGYCIGGTLLTLTLAALAAKGDARFNAASFMVSLQDFSRVGDTAVFMDEPALDLIEQQMMDRGYLDSREMANMFNLLRSNDLIWANVVNNYLMGNKPPAFDLLYWNSDGTRMTRAAHSWYLRNTYVENNLIEPGKVTLKSEPIDLGRIQQDVYAVGAEKDHIVPWDAAWRITQLFGGDVRFVLASSGHIAGIINPPGGKGSYWTQDAGGTVVSSPAQWLKSATRHEGSWWSD
ncbi:PHA/PHB synthase family protein [Microvirga massiliensis]|uniref:PHA/PHB synthase family protein n=1 Tax=Microvirga massiliensis TaxID=1033741 RepID=UPI000AE23333|nr:alpha/beta fold hydrolase [Microvirga massiliensis]